MDRNRLVKIIVVQTIIAALVIGLFINNDYSTPVADAGISLPPSFYLAIYGTEKHPLNNPTGVAIGTNGNVFVTDTGNNQIQVFRSNGRFAFKFGQKGPEKGNFDYPVGIAISNNGEVYVTEINNLRMQVFNENGKFLREFPKNKKDLLAPTAISVAKNGDVLVIDRGTQQLKKFSKDGRLLQVLGGQGKLNNPMGVTTDQKGNIWVADSGNRRVMVYGDKGKYLRSLKKNQAEWILPRGLAADDYGHLYVVDTMGHYFAQTTNHEATVLTYGQMGEQNEQFLYPDGVAYRDGRLCIADRGNNRVVVYLVSK